MALTPGTRLGPYEITGQLGAGGMGEVYRARDTRLDRTVAIKVMPPDVAADPQFRTRFDREARAISQLQHPHICTLHDVGEVDGTAFLVMELLQGQTLADRLQKGPLPIGEALKIAIEVSDALSAAHKQGIVHRDLKPANIMLTKSGAKLLDFGLAKAATPVVSMSVDSTQATSSHHLTGSGTILGTLHYMSPEQVEGREADARSDIWALGAVLYEVITGTRPFVGDSAATVIGAILKDAPAPISSRQPLAPASVDAAVRRCLAKNPEERWHSAADLRAVLDWIATGLLAPAAVSSMARGPKALIAATAGLAIVALAVSAATGWRYLTVAPVVAQVVQLDLLPPADAMLSPAPVASAAQMALSADGKQIAFVALKRRGASQIYVRPLDSRDARALPDTDGAAFPFWSPDGQYVGFFARGKLKKVAVAGGAAEEICEAPAPRYATWNRDGVILLSLSPRGPIYRVSANGGQPTPATTISPGTVSHQWPQFLPDGRHFLYYQRSLDPKFEGVQGVYVGELGSTLQSTRVLAIGGMAVYFAGHLAFVRDGVLFAQRFDSGTLQTSGDPIRIADHIGYFSGSLGYSAIAGSASGALAFGPSVGMTTSLEWRTRSGPNGHLLTSAVYSSPRLSFDEKSVAVATAGQTMADRDIWTIDIERNDPQRATTDPSADWFPTWSPDGQRIIFASSRLGVTQVFQKVGAGQDAMVGKRVAFALYPTDVSIDGQTLLCTLSNDNGYDIAVMPIDKPEQMTALPWATKFNEVQARFAPNTRFLAYASDESGRFEVYVRPYASADNRRWKVSLAGGMQPEWRRDGKELFFISGDGKMMAAPISVEDDFQSGPPRALFDVEIPEPVAPYPTDYAVTKDGQRFLVNTVVEQPNRPALTVLLNWTESERKSP